MRVGILVVLALVLNFVCGVEQEKTAEPLTVPPYQNLPTTEGHFQGVGGVRLFYAWLGAKAIRLFSFTALAAASILAATTWSRSRHAGTVC